jgi:hypothetical protein
MNQEFFNFYLNASKQLITGNDALKCVKLHLLPAIILDRGSGR